MKTTKPLEIVHADVIGPMDTKTPSGARFALTLIDDYSRLVSNFFVRNKSEVCDCVMVYVVLMDRHLEGKLKCLRTDNGGEFVNKTLQCFFRARGIVHQATTPYNPQQNDVAERMNRTIAATGRAMLYYKRVEKRWWAEAMSTAVYVINRIPNSVNTAATPHELCFGVRPSLENLRVLGSEGYAFTDAAKRSKLDGKVFPCVFLGYSATTKAYRVWNKQAKKIVVSKTVALDERGSPQYTTISMHDDNSQLHVFDDDDEVDVASRAPRTREADGSSSDAMKIVHEEHQPSEPMDVDVDNGAVMPGAPSHSFSTQGGTWGFTPLGMRGNAEPGPARVEAIEEGAPTQLVFQPVAVRRMPRTSPRFLVEDARD